MTDKKLKHLEFIQNIINRMANTSFLLKGWSITVIAGLAALALDKNKSQLIWLALVFTVVFWFLDAYFLWQERLFRDLYDEVRKRDDTKIDFGMSTAHLHKHKWYGTPFSITLMPFYLGVLLLLGYIIYANHG